VAGIVDPGVPDLRLDPAATHLDLAPTRKTGAE
jgi:hypothetical protein